MTEWQPKTMLVTLYDIDTWRKPTAQDLLTDERIQVLVTDARRAMLDLETLIGPDEPEVETVKKLRASLQKFDT